MKKDPYKLTGIIEIRGRDTFDPTNVLAYLNDKIAIEVFKKFGLLIRVHIKGELNA